MLLTHLRSDVMRPSQLLLCGLYAMALAAFAGAMFILFSFEPYDPLNQSWDVPPFLLALALAIYGVFVILGARHLQLFVEELNSLRGGSPKDDDAAVSH